MAKFYIESGNFRMIVISDNYLEAVKKALTNLGRRQIQGIDQHIRLGPSVGVNEMGYSTDILQSKIRNKFPTEDFTDRKEKFISATSLKKKNEYKDGFTLFLPTKELVKMIDLD